MNSKFVKNADGNFYEVQEPDIQMSLEAYYSKIRDINADNKLSALAKSMMRRRLAEQTGYGL